MHNNNMHPNFQFFIFIYFLKIFLKMYKKDQWNFLTIY